MKSGLRMTQPLFFEGINKSKLEIFGTLRKSVLVDNGIVNLLFYVLSSNTMYDECLLGRNFIAD